MKKVLTILSLIICVSCADTDKLVDEIVIYNTMESAYVGWGIKSEEFARFQKFKSIASNEELKNLTLHKNAIVRTYVYLTLIERELISTAFAFKEAMRNNESFSTMSADMKLSSDVCNEIYFSAIRHKTKSNSKTKSNDLKKLDLEINEMDSLIIYEMNNNKLLHYMAFKDKTYPTEFNVRITELAEVYNNESAIFYLDGHDFIKDTTKILKSINYILDNVYVGYEPEKKLLELRTNLKNKNRS